MSTANESTLLLDADIVSRYLREHPDFLERHPHLISELSLPHEAGSAVSLVERQVSLLRERNIDLRRRMNQLLEAAESNDALFDRTRTLTLALLDAATFADVDRVLAERLQRDFDADHARCHFTCAAATLPDAAHLRCLAAGEAPPLAHLVQANGAACGMLRRDEMASLFGTAADRAGSAVLIALEHAGLRGLLAVGSRRPDGFTPDMDTLFVRHIGEVLARTLARIVARSLARHDTG